MPGFPDIVGEKTKLHIVAFVVNRQAFIDNVNHINHGFVSFIIGANKFIQLEHKDIKIAGFDLRVNIFFLKK